MPLYDFRDADGHVTEALRPYGTMLIRCRCGLPADRVEVNRGIGIVGPTTDTRGMFRRFQEASAEMDHAATRMEEQTGQPAETPNLWQVAKHRAVAMSTAGENPYPTQKSTEK